MPESELLTFGEAAKQMLEKMRVLGKPKMNFSQDTGKYYLTFEPSIDVKDGISRIGVTEHAGSPELAIRALYKSLKDVNKVIIVGSWDKGESKEYVYSPFIDDFVPHTADCLSVEI